MDSNEPTEETLTRDTDAPPRSEDRLEVAEQVGRFRVLATVGAGGMGRVYAAYDPKLDRKVAVKVLHAERAGRGMQRLLREAQALARLQHPNVVAIHDVGVHRGRVFIAMEYVEGDTLRGWVREQQGPDRCETILRTLIAAGRGLAAAHRAGLVHRDFKPSNVLCGADGRVKVVDFGLARSEGATSSEDHEETEPQRISSVEQKLTQTGVAVGTPAYMSLEQFAGREIDARSDVFSFCITAWEILFQQKPFGGETALALMVAIREGKIDPPPADAGVPGWVEPLLRRGLARRPASRFATIAELLDNLEAKLDPPPPMRRSLFAVAGVGVIAIVAAGAIASLLGGDGAACEDVSPIARRLSPPLDAYATALLDAERDACEDTRVRHEQTEAMMQLRLQCLDERRRDLVAVAGAAAGERAERATRNLRQIERCADADYVLARPAAPTDPTQAATDLAVRAEIANAEAADLAVADQILAGLTDEVAAADHPPLHAVFALARARLHRDRGELDKAESALATAYTQARRGGDRYVAAAAAQQMASLLDAQARDAAAARWGAVARVEATLDGEPRLVEEADALPSPGDG